MWPFIDYILEEEVPTKEMMSYLRMVSFSRNMKIQNAEDLKKIEDNITAMINSPLTRFNGLVLWSCALSKSKIYLSNWGKILLAGLQSKDSFAVKEQCAIILKKMIYNFGSINEYLGTFMKHLPDIVPILLSDCEANQGFVDSCNSLALCMTRFPQILGSHMVDIECFVMNNLNTDSVPNIEALSDCFAVIPKCLVYNKQKTRQPYKDVWYSTFVKTLNTLHVLLDDIARLKNANLGLEELQPIFEVPCEVKEEIPILYNKIRSLAVLSRCLAKLMSCEAGRVQAPVADLLVLIQKMVAFQLDEEVQVNNQNGELAMLFLVFPKVCEAVFTLLEALVLNFPVHEQVTGIMSLVTRTIHVSRSHHSVFYSQVRCMIWKFLHIWIQQCGSKVTAEITSEIIDELLIDVSLQNSEVNDQVVEIFQYSSCMEALKVLNSVLISGSCFLTTKNLEDISTTTIRTIRKLLIHLNPTKSFPFPYNNEDCRLELYNLLLTCSISGDAARVKSTLKSINLFKLALKDPSIKVKEVCHRAFAICRFYLHPKKPPPDCMLPIKPIEVPQPILEDNNFLADWESSGWQSGQLNGHATNGESNQAHASYAMEGSSYQQDPMEEGEIIHEDDSPPHYTNLEPVHKRTMSEQSSRSYNAEEEEIDSESEGEVEEDKESSEEEEEQPTYSGRPNIQVLTAYSTGPRAPEAVEIEEHPKKKEDSEDEVMVENGEPEESDEVEEEEEDLMDEDEEVEEEEKAEEDEEQPPQKKQRVEEEEEAEQEAKDVEAEIEEEEGEACNDVEAEDEVVTSEVQEAEVGVEAEEEAEVINGDIEEESEHSDADEPPLPVAPEITMTVEQIMSNFSLVEKPR